MFAEVFARRLRVGMDLRGKRLIRIKFDLWSDEFEELKPRLTAIEVAGIVEKVAFDVDAVRVAHRGADADIRNGDVAAAVLKIHLRGVYAVPGHKDAVREVHIYCGRAEIRAEVVAGMDGIGESVRVAEETVRRFHITGGDKLPYISGADDAPIYAQRGDDVTAEAVFVAVFLKPRGRPPPPYSRSRSHARRLSTRCQAQQ